MKPVQVSVMMPAYNAEAYIGDAIESVLAQEFADWELIIVNDGSTDQTASVVRRYADPRIRVINQPNGGEAAARNTALDYMQGQYIAFLDADDLWRPHHLALSVAYLQTHPEIQAMYTDGNFCDQDGRAQWPLSDYRRGPFEGWIFPEIVRASDVLGPPVCVVLQRSVIEANAFRFDPEIRVIGTDWDFMTRYAEVASFGYLPEKTILYRIHQANMTLHTNPNGRALSWARCREKAIHLQRFVECPADVRVAVYYDLLVNLLHNYPQRQQAILNGAEFSMLPAAQQARLLRLMAGRALSSGNYDLKTLKAWVQRARGLNPSDWRAHVLGAIVEASPSLGRVLLRAAKRYSSEAIWPLPFQS